MSEREANIYELDAGYKPFPTFAAWRSQTIVNEVLWNEYIAHLLDAEQLTPEMLNRAHEIAKRAAAIDTGAIEGL
jgi:hypothetical protein